MKKFFSLVLALVMALSLTTVAWGAIADTDAAKIGDTGYATLADAVADVAVGGTATITLLKSHSGAGIFLDDADNKTITIDFATYTYTCTGPAVGSAGTATQAFHLEENNTVKMMNGTVTSNCADVKMLVQNYCDLTLENMVLDGTQLPGSGRYTLSNNQGNVVIDDTTITAAADGIAFDTCEYGSYTPPTVTVKGTSVINGTVEAAGGTLEVQSGTVNGDIDVVGDGQASDVVVKGGTFSTDVSKYVADGYRLVNGTVASVPANTNGVVGGYEGQLTVKDAPRQAITNFTKTAAVTPDDVNEDGLYNMPGDVIGSIEYYTFNLGGGVAQNYYQVDSVNDADLIVYVGDSLVPYMYLANEPAGGFQYWYGVASFNDFGSACGQFKYVDYDATKSYYTYAGQVFVLADDGAVNLRVGTKFVQADVITADGKWVAHTPVYTQNDKGVVTAVSCAKCTDVGVIVANYAALPTAMKAPGMNFQLPGSTTKYYYWADTAAVVTPDTDKTVTSADTFDAGIAMYVGMSVMAAAGSVVVLKKRED